MSAKGLGSWSLNEPATRLGLGWVYGSPSLSRMAYQSASPAGAGTRTSLPASASTATRYSLSGDPDSGRLNKNHRGVASAFKWGDRARSRWSPMKTEIGRAVGMEGDGI